MKNDPEEVLSAMRMGLARQVCKTSYPTIDFSERMNVGGELKPVGGTPKIRDGKIKIEDNEMKVFGGETVFRYYVMDGHVIDGKTCRKVWPAGKKIDGDYQPPAFAGRNNTVVHSAVHSKS